MSTREELAKIVGSENVYDDSFIAYAQIFGIMVGVKIGMKRKIIS